MLVGAPADGVKFVLDVFIYPALKDGVYFGAAMLDGIKDPALGLNAGAFGLNGVAPTLRDLNLQKMVSSYYFRALVPFENIECYSDRNCREMGTII